ncbi:unnamed protein product [Darwinula stevensoni]|uniref:Kringle domain-containing protein n=1 Tax=Darwinula stevensoni TaxID=69355 RepID=A0A7R9A3C5_9CRUS|nr:unnamed protein product [Darwinula stevensoni]CAG0887595.1 unnamed protein product [Darwinula stevensoni]
MGNPQNRWPNSRLQDRQDILKYISMQDLNYCRNPTSAEQPWCFVSRPWDLIPEWEFCDIPFCSCRKESPECRLTLEGREYAGMKNVDGEGRRCQPWLTSDPKRFHRLNFFAFPDQLMDYSNNYCRNPGSGETTLNALQEFWAIPDKDDLWCFIKEKTSQTWGLCKVPFCYELYERSALEGKPTEGYPECLQTEMGKEYVGTTRKTRSGNPCLRWDTQPFGKLEDFDPNLTYDDHFRFGNPASHQDFCRNPTLKEKPWCFVSDLEKIWDYCDIPRCPDLHNKTECKWTHNGEEYAGTLNVTVSGRLCLPWNDSGLLDKFWPKFPEDVTSENHNFCRNPTGKKDLPYCFVGFDNDEKTFEGCDIPFCPLHYLHERCLLGNGSN